MDRTLLTRSIRTYVVDFRKDRARLISYAQWGGSPFKDLVAGLQFVKRVYGNMIDTERMAMAGGSYGCVLQVEFIKEAPD